MLSLFGYGVFHFLFFGALWRQACRWRYLAQSYAGAPDAAIETRTGQNAVLLGLGGYNSLAGILVIGAHKTGISLRLLKPFSLFHSPLFIPYSDIEGWTTSWYLNAPSVELAFRRAHEVKMIVPAEQAEWIAAASGSRSVRLHNIEAPEGPAGRGWHAFSLAHAIISAAMLCLVSALLLVNWLRA